MNTEKNDGNKQDKAEVKVDIGSKNDNQSRMTPRTISPRSIMTDAVTSKPVQLESKATVIEQSRMNNNSSESDIKYTPLSKSAVALSNGTKSVETSASDCANSLEQNVSQDASKVNISSVFTSTVNIKAQTVNANAMCQLKHKTAVNSSTLNLPKSQMHLNLSSTQANINHNHNLASAVLNSTAAISTAHANVSTTNVPLMPPNLSIIKPNDDMDMKNNVDYASVIEKCPSKVSCSSDSSPEADCSWTSKSYGSKRILNNIGGSIGSTSQGTCCFLRPNINCSREAAGPSGLQKVGSFIYQTSATRILYSDIKFSFVIRPRRENRWNVWILVREMKEICLMVKTIASIHIKEMMICFTQISKKS